MSSAYDNTAGPRFFRPADATRVRRNQRRIQFQRAGALLRTLLFVAAVGGAAFWLWRQTQSDARFAVRHVEITGAVHTPRAALAQLASRYTGANLFRIDIARLQHDLGSLAWVERIEIEKKIPDTLRINVIERTPAALLRHGAALDYVDRQGVVLDRLSPAIGDADLPVVDAVPGPEAGRAVRLLEGLRASDPEIYSRIAEVRPLPPSGFAIYDRDLRTTVYANEAGLSSQWRSFYAIAAAEHLGPAGIEYADLRFADRVIVKPVHPIAVVSAPHPAIAPVSITN